MVKIYNSDHKLCKISKQQKKVSKLLNGSITLLLNINVCKKRDQIRNEKGSDMRSKYNKTAFVYFCNVCIL